MRLLVLLGLVGILGGCAGYKEVSDPNDGANGKTKARPSSVR
jgi:hypothetical protein